MPGIVFNQELKCPNRAFDLALNALTVQPLFVAYTLKFLLCQIPKYDDNSCCYYHCLYNRRKQSCFCHVSPDVLFYYSFLLLRFCEEYKVDNH